MLTIEASEPSALQSPEWKCPICLKYQLKVCQASRKTANSERICRILGAICWEHWRLWKKRKQLRFHSWLQFEWKLKWSSFYSKDGLKIIRGGFDDSDATLQAMLCDVGSIEPDAHADCRQLDALVSSRSSDYWEKKSQSCLIKNSNKIFHLFW